MPIVKGINKTSDLKALINNHTQVRTLGKDMDLSKAPAAPKPDVIDERPRETVDRTLQDNCFWERGTFTVPEDIPHERVMRVKDKYKVKLGKVLDRQGIRVLEMFDPMPSDRLPEQGRKRYDILVQCRRDPVEFVIDIPDQFVPEMQKKGMKLKE